MARPGGDGDPAEMDERAELLRRVRGALGSGEISRADLVAILREGRSAAPGRIGATQVLSGLGAAVIVLGLTLIYARAFTAMADRAQLTTPFIFPLAASGLFVVVVRGGRPLWEREAAAFVVLATLGAALAASYAGTAGIDAWAWGTVAAAVVVGAALAMLGLHRPRLRAADAGLLTGLIVGAHFAAAWIGLGSGAVRILEIALAICCVIAGYFMNRRSPDAASLPFAAAVILMTIACVLGISEGLGEDITGLSAWHALLTVTVAGATVAAAVTRQPVLWLVATAGAVTWLVMTLPVAGAGVGWALVVVAMGLALVIVGPVATRLRSRRERRGAAMRDRR